MRWGNKGEPERVHYKDFLESFDMTHCKPRSSPCEKKLKSENEGEPVDLKKYREVLVA